MSSARAFVVDVDGVHLAGTLRGDGDPVLLLHGGPGLSVDYLDPLVDELAAAYAVATFQQRGLAPSQVEGPFAVADHVADCARVLDALGWERATVVGHSWGGHLALHLATSRPDLVTALLLVDTLGGAGDGGLAEFDRAMNDRTPPEHRERASELDERAMRGEGTVEEALEAFGLVWPAYFADPGAAPAMPPMGMTVEGYGGTFESLVRELPALERALPAIAVPTGFVAGAASPMPRSASTDTAVLIPNAWVEAIAGAGHIVWHEAPGSVRAALDRLAVG